MSAYVDTESVRILVQSAYYWGETGRIKLLDGNTFGQPITFSPDGKALICYGFDNAIKFWSVENDQLIKSIKLRFYYSTISFSPDGKTIATVIDDEEDKIIEILSVANGKRISILNGHTSYITTIKISSDNRFLASGSYDNTVKVWDLKTGKSIRTLKGHTEVVKSVAFSTDNKILASGSEDATIKFWNIVTGKLIKSVNADSIISSPGSIVFSPDGKILASGGEYNNSIMFWNTQTKQLDKELKGYATSVKSVSFSPNGKILAKADENKIALWNMETGEQIKL